MTPEQFYILKRQLYTRIPLAGAWLRRRAVEAFIRDGSPEAVRVLAEAVTRSHDRQVVDMAVTALRRLTNQTCINNVCAVWATTRYPKLTEFIMAHEWVASKPANIKVLTAMKIGKIDAVIRAGADVIDPLLQACEDPDEEIRPNARECLSHLHHQEAREALCRKAIEEENPIVYEIVKEAQYAPRDPAQRALFYFLTEQWDQYEQLDFDQTLLKTIYPHLDTAIQKRLAVCARKAGRVELIEVVVEAHHQKKQLAKMTVEDWEAALSILSARQTWQSIWQLAQIAPAVWSVRLLSKLRDGQWTPELDAERAVFERISGLVEHCQHEHIEHLSRDVRCFAILQKQAARIACFAISPDSRLLASGSSDGLVQLWRLPEGEAGQTLEGHTNVITCLAISPDSQRLVSSDRDGTMQLWRLPEGRAIRTIKGYHGDAECLAISPDGRLFASSVKRSGTVRLWRLPKGEIVRTLKEYQDLINPNIIRCLAISPDSRLLISGTQGASYENARVQLWRLTEGKASWALQSWTLSGHIGAVTCLAISPDRRLLASGGFDHKVQLWWLPGGKALQTLKGHTDNIMCLAMSPDGRLLASGSLDNTVRLWRLPEGEAVQVLKGHTDYVSCLVMSPDGRLLASSSKDGTVRLWQSTLVRLTTVPVGQITQQDMAWLENTLQAPDLTAGERMWLELTLELSRW